MAAVILAGHGGFGRCDIESQTLPALWPICGRPVIEFLVERLQVEGINSIVICASGATNLGPDIIKVRGSNVHFLNDRLPCGTAGCIRNAASVVDASLLLVLGATTCVMPAVSSILGAHTSDATMTAIFNRTQTADADANSYRPTGIYVMSRKVMDYIPQEGYCDIKEALIPALLRDGLNVAMGVLDQRVISFRDSSDYIYAIDSYVSQLASTPHCEVESLTHATVHRAKTAQLAESARLFGNICVMDGAIVDENVVVFGPALIGPRCRIRQETVLIRSALWENVVVGSGCHLTDCLVGANVKIRPRKTLSHLAIASKTPATRIEGAQTVPRQRLLSSSLRLAESAAARIHAPDRGSAVAKIAPVVAIVVLAAALFWSFSDTWKDLWHIWRESDEYSSGVLVPFLAMYVVWSRRKELLGTMLRPCIWGILAIAFSVLVRLLGTYYMYSSAERLSTVLCIAALVLFICGWRLFARLWPVLLFLFLMLPWPVRVQEAVTLPLQRWATNSAVFCLETIGYNVTQYGNTIDVGSTRIAIAEACNGLRMVTAFCVIGALVVLLINRPLWQKFIVLLSCLPIALLCNTIRLVLTAVAFTLVSGETWESVFHDFGGYAMMPLALGLILGELWLIEKLTTPPETRTVSVVTARNKSET